MDKNEEIINEEDGRTEHELLVEIEKNTYNSEIELTQMHKDIVSMRKWITFMGIIVLGALILSVLNTCMSL